MTRRQLSQHQRQQLRQKIILFSGISIIVAVVLLITAGWVFGEYLPNNKTIVTVYDTKIKAGDLVDTMEYYAAMYASYGQTLDLNQQTDYILSSMVQNELLRRAAGQLGISVSEEEIDKQLGESAGSARKAIREMARASLLVQKLKDEHFGPQVGDTGPQVKINAMLVESANLIPEIRARLMSGDNITVLAEEFALNTASKTAKGAFDWHPRDVLKDDIGSSIPVDWAFSDDVTAGQISDGLTDNVSSKQLGYWLLRLNEKPVTAEDDSTANVSAVFLSSKAQAEEVRELLEDSGNLAAIAEQYSQYSLSKQGKGELGIVAASSNISGPFNDYVFGEDTPVGVWSEPIKDTQFWTTGGVWFVQVVDKSSDREYAVLDKDELVDKAYSEWSGGLMADTDAYIKYDFSDAQRTWAIERANKKIADLMGG